MNEQEQHTFIDAVLKGGGRAGKKKLMLKDTTIACFQVIPRWTIQTGHPKQPEVSDNSDTRQ